jgi:phenylalanyl-tRNA synthetase beta chain
MAAAAPDRAIGLRPINALVDSSPIFITYDRGRPLHRVRRRQRCRAISRCGARATARVSSRSTASAIASTKHVRHRRRSGGWNRWQASWAARATAASETTTDVLIESALWDP